MHAGRVPIGDAARYSPSRGGAAQRITVVAGEASAPPRRRPLRRM